MQYIILISLIMLLASCGNTSKGPTTKPCDDKTYCHIFISSSTTKGNISASGDGILIADDICKASKPANTGTVKAFLSDGINRVACATGNADCLAGTTGRIDWVLSANKEYRRTGGAIVIGTTNDEGLFTFPLISDFYATAGTIFTGMNTDYTPAVNDCTNWTVITGTGATGLLDSDTSSALYNTNSNCNTNHHILCVEQ
jgi:Protein of unknown function (DUF1554)